jgi:hypothetical protein
MALVEEKQHTTVHQDLLVSAAEVLTVQEVQVAVLMVVQAQALQVVVQVDQDTEQVVQADVMVQVYLRVVEAVEQDLLVVVVEDVDLGAMAVVVVAATGTDIVQTADRQKLDQDVLREIQAMRIEDQLV